MQRIFFFSFLLLLTALTGWSQEAVFEWRAVNTFPIGATCTQRFTQWGQPPIVVVEIEGKKYRFLLDTGAPTVVSSRLRKKRKMSRLGTVRVVDALGNSAQTEVVCLPAMQLGAIGIAQIPTLVYDTGNPIFSQLGVEGILGSNALAGLTVSFSARDNSIQFTASASAESTIGDSMLLREDAQGTPAIPVVLNGGAPQYFLFDTGFEGLCDMAPGLARKVAGGNSVAIRFLQSDGGYMGINGSATRWERLHVSQLQIGSEKFQNVAASVTGDTRSKIGAALLQLGDVTLNFPAARFSFQSYSQ